MKAKIVLLLVTIVVVITIISLLKNEKSSDVIDVDHLLVNTELHDVVFCNNQYTIKPLVFNGVDVGQRVAEIMNSNYLSDTFPLPGSSDPIYEGMSEVSQNIRYSTRPHAIVTTVCGQFESEQRNGELPITQVITTDTGYTFRIGSSAFYISEKANTFDEFGLDPNPEDVSGMGGIYTISLQ